LWPSSSKIIEEGKVHLLSFSDHVEEECIPSVMISGNGGSSCSRLNQTFKISFVHPFHCSTGIQKYHPWIAQEERLTGLYE
jgi:hypothetical protein